MSGLPAKLSKSHKNSVGHPLKVENIEKWQRFVLTSTATSHILQDSHYTGLPFPNISLGTVSGNRASRTTVPRQSMDTREYR
jgi:hypothetical protein